MRLSTRQSVVLAAVLAAMPVASASAQVILTESFEDGLGAIRWNYVGRESTVAAADAAGSNTDAQFNFNFDYAANSIPAPVGGGTKGVYLTVNTDATGRAAAGAIMPNAVSVGSHFEVTLDMYARVTGTSGTTQVNLIGLNTTGTGVTGDNLAAPTGVTPNPNASAGGYAFATSFEGGAAGDFRVYARAIPGDDGPRYPKVNAAWTGNATLPNFDTAGLWTGANVLPEEVNLNGNSYFTETVFPTSSYPDNGTPSNAWTKVTLRQRGVISEYLLNGLVINTLFTPTEQTGKPQLGVYDLFNSATPAGIGVIYDNVQVATLPTPVANVMPTGDTTARFNAGGTVTANGAVTLNSIVMDTAGTTLAGTGTITLGPVSGAVYAAGGAHVISKPISITASTAISVAAPTDSLSLSSVSFGSNVYLHKVGQGRLDLPSFNTTAFTISTGKVVLANASASKSNYLYLEYQPAAGGAATLNSAILDFAKGVVAVDYPSNANATGVTASLSPLTTIRNLLNSGIRADTTDPLNPLATWTGPGLVTSAPEVQGAGFFNPTSTFTVRAAEASVMGYANGATWRGYTIDATTVIFGFTLRADTNLDQAVNFDDLLKMAAAYNTSGLDTLTSWASGDGNGDGSVNFDDLLLLAAAYNSSVTGSLGGDWALAQAAVPEPTSLAVIGIGAAGLLGRRRR
jgi:hypothetical protein